VGGVTLGLVAPLAVHAQQTAKVPRVGMIGLPPLGAPELQEARDAFRQGLREHGYVEGQNIVIERRSADGKFERIPQLVNELVRLKVDVIVVGSTQVARAAGR
jgi:putative ABC transport system substrate-binding protein